MKQEQYTHQNRFKTHNSDKLPAAKAPSIPALECSLHSIEVLSESTFECRTVQNPFHGGAEPDKTSKFWTRYWCDGTSIHRQKSRQSRLHRHHPAIGLRANIQRYARDLPCEGC